MAVAVFMEWPGVSEEQYNAVMEELELDEDTPDGALFHLASFTGAGLRVVDIWESAEAFYAFNESRLMPAVAAVGIATEPRIEIHPVHNVYSPGIDLIAQMGASSLPEHDEEAVEP